MAGEEIKAWPLQGYAPGGYFCRCKDCRKEFEGDKRATQCLECAVITSKRANLELFEGCQHRDAMIKAGAETISRLQEKNAKAVAILMGDQ